jgi:hypothetical protein
MNKSIRTYDELVEYQRNLQQLLYAQKELIRYDIEDIKEQVRPVTEIAAKATKLFVPSGDQSLLVKIANTAIDLLMKNVVMKKSGWVTKVVIPFLVHNISSHLVADNKEGIFKRIIKLFTKNKKK